jgi:rod shape-determining protein MreD
MGASTTRPIAGLARPAAAAAALVAVLLVQLTIVNGVPFPRGGAPDLVLLTVIAIGLVSGPRVGLAAGFLAGLALDLVPPASNLVGQYALVFCLAGYASGRMRGSLRRSALLAIGCAVVVAGAAEAMATGLTVALGTPVVAMATVARVLPAALAYDMALAPLVLVVVVRVAVKLGSSVGEGVMAPALEPGGSASPAAAGAPGRRVPVPGNGDGRRAGGRTVAPGEAGLPWVVGDRTAAGAHVGSVGWLSRPATSRRARRKQDKLTAALTGARPRKGDSWLTERPAGPLTAAAPTGAPSSRLGRLRPWAGVPGMAASVALFGRPPGTSGARPGGAARPLHIDASWDEHRHRHQAGAEGPWGTPDGHGADRHAVFGPGVPRIPFGSDGDSSRHRPASPGVPKISFGSDGVGPARHQHDAHPARMRHGAFAHAPSVPAPRVRRTAPKIAFGTLNWPRAVVTNPRRPAEPKFAGAPSAARPARSAGIQRAQPHFRLTAGTLAHSSLLRTSTVGGARANGMALRTPRTAKMGAGRHLRWLPWARVRGGRSTVWRIGSARMGMLR